MDTETTHTDAGYNALFARLSEVPAPLNLDHTIVQAIYVRETHAAEVRLACLGGVSLASVAGIVVSSVYVSHVAAQSGFTSYLSLAFSDSSTLAVYWKQFALSLMESLPLVGVTAFLSAVGLFIWSSAKAAANGMRVFART